MRTLRLIVFPLILCVLYAPTLRGQSLFSKVKIMNAYGAAKEGDRGRLVVAADKISFVKRDKQRNEYFWIPLKSVTEIFYSRVSGRRIGAAILISPLLLLTKGRKHYMTLTFDDGVDNVGAVEFKLHKSNYRGVLRSVEQVTGKIMKYDQEGIKDREQTVANRGDDPSAAKLNISSDPPGAEIEIDGAYVGHTPRVRRVISGKHKIKIRLKGHRAWKRTVNVSEGESLEVSALLERKR